MSEQATKFRTEDMRPDLGTLAREHRGSLLGTQAQKSSSLLAKCASLEPLTTNELNRATQCIVLQFSTDQAAEEQGSCERAVEQQKNGVSGISTVKLINWARRNARVRAEVGRLIGLSGHVTDPDFMEGVAKLVASIVREQTHPEVHAMGNNDTNSAGEVDDLTGDLFSGP